MSCINPEILRKAYQQMALSYKESDYSEFADQLQVKNWLDMHPDAKPQDLLKEAILRCFKNQPSLVMVHNRIEKAVINQNPLKVALLDLSRPYSQEGEDILMATERNTGLACLRIHYIGIDDSWKEPFTNLSVALGFNRQDTTCRRWVRHAIDRSVHSKLHNMLLPGVFYQPFDPKSNS